MANNKNINTASASENIICIDDDFICLNEGRQRVKLNCKLPIENNRIKWFKTSRGSEFVKLTFVTADGKNEMDYFLNRDGYRDTVQQFVSCVYMQESKGKFPMSFSGVLNYLANGGEMNLYMKYRDNGTMQTSIDASILGIKVK